MECTGRFRWIYEHTAFRYLIGGGTGALVHFLLLIGLIEAFATPPVIATSIGFIIGSLVNYTLQYHWTFAADGPHHVMLGRYALVTTITMLINDALFWVFTEQLGVHYLLAQGIATGAMLIVNYVVNKNFTFATS